MQVVKASYAWWVESGVKRDSTQNQVASYSRNDREIRKGADTEKAIFCGGCLLGLLEQCQGWCPPWWCWRNGTRVVALLPVRWPLPSSTHHCFSSFLSLFFRRRGIKKHRRSFAFKTDKVVGHFFHSGKHPWACAWVPLSQHKSQEKRGLVQSWAKWDPCTVALLQSTVKTH